MNNDFTNATATIELVCLHEAGLRLVYELDIVLVDADDAKAEALESIRDQAESIDDDGKTLAIIDALGDDDDQQNDLYIFEHGDELPDGHECGSVEHVYEGFEKVMNGVSECGIAYALALELTNAGRVLDEWTTVCEAEGAYEVAQAYGHGGEIPSEYHQFVDWAALIADKGWHRDCDVWVCTA